MQTEFFFVKIGFPIILFGKLGDPSPAFGIKILNLFIKFSFPKKMRTSLLQMQKYSLLIQKKSIIKFLTKLLKGLTFQLKSHNDG